MKEFFKNNIVILLLFVVGCASGSILVANHLRVRTDANIGSTADPDSSALFQITSTSKGSVTCPKMTAAQRDAISTPTAGLCVFNTDSNALNVYNGTVWGAVGGSGVGGINYIDDTDAEGGVGSWTTYADAAGTSPVDGTAGSASITFAVTTTASEILRGTQSFKIAKGASNEQGEGVSYDFIIDRTDKAYPQPQTISFDYDVSANFDYGDADDPSSDPSDIVVYIYDKDNSSLIQPVGFHLDGSGHFKAQFQPLSNSEDYRLILHIAGTTATAWDFFFDNVQVGPTKFARGPPLEDAKDVIVTGSWVTNTTYTAKMSRFGQWAFFEVKLNTSGAPTSSNLEINLPITIDADALAAETTTTPTLRTHLGSATLFESGIASYHGKVAYLDTDSVEIRFINELNESGNKMRSSVVNATSPFTWGASDEAHIIFRVPVLGWSSNTLVSSDADTRVVGLIVPKTSGSHTSSGTWQTVASWDSVTADTHSAFNTTSGEFTIPVSGYYQVLGGVCFDNNTTGQRGLRIQVDGATKHTCYFDDANSSSNEHCMPLSGLVKANVGSVITVDAFQSSGGTLIYDADSGGTGLSINRVSGPSQIAASETVVASAHTTAGRTSDSSTDLNFDTADYDSHGGFSSGVYTVQIAGTYHLSVSTSLTLGAVSVAVYKNGVFYRELYKHQSASPDIRNGSTSIQAETGDTLSIRSLSSSTFDNDDSAMHFSVHRLGF